MAEEPKPKRFKVRFADADPEQVMISSMLTDEGVRRVIAGAVGMPEEAERIALVELDNKAHVAMSFSSLTHDGNYMVQHYPQKGPAQVSEWYNITGVLSGWARRFDARRGLFHSAANAGAQGAKDKCIVHTMGNGNIQLNLWFPTEEGLQRFDAALAVSAEVFGNHTMKLERKKAPPPTPDLAAVFALDYTKDKDSPQPYATSNSGAGATVASGLRKKLQNQRVAITDEMTYKNMHIIPAALLGDSRKLACRWLYLAGSGEFHDWFDGPQKAPHIKVTIDKETPSMYAGETEFTLKVDTSRVGSRATITKPVLAVDSPDGTGYVTTVHIPSVQADNFRFALNWRASCFDEAWKRNAADLPVNTNDAGGHGWWHCVDLGEDLLSAIEAAKVSLEEGTDEAW